MKPKPIDWDAYMSSVVIKEIEYWTRKEMQMRSIRFTEEYAPKLLPLFREMDTQPDQDLMRYWQASFRSN